MSLTYLTNLVTDIILEIQDLILSAMVNIVLDILDLFRGQNLIGMLGR